jgi:hypothetical protein
MVDRKLTALPDEYAGLFQQVPKSDDFVLEEISK